MYVSFFFLYYIYLSIYRAVFLVSVSQGLEGRDKLMSQTSMPEGRELQSILSHVGFIEEEKMLVPGVKVRAASVKKLASLAVDCFGE